MCYICNIYKKINIFEFSRFLKALITTRHIHIDCNLGEQTFRENIQPPRQVAHVECSRTLRVNFKLFSNLCF